MGDEIIFFGLVGLGILLGILAFVVVSPLVGLLIGTGMGGRGGWRNFLLGFLPGLSPLVTVWVVYIGNGTIWNAPTWIGLVSIVVLLWVVVFIGGYRLSAIKAITGGILVPPLALIVSVMAGPALLITLLSIANACTMIVGG